MAYCFCCGRRLSPVLLIIPFFEFLNILLYLNQEWTGDEAFSKIAVISLLPIPSLPPLRVAVQDMWNHAAFVLDGVEVILAPIALLPQAERLSLSVNLFHKKSSLLWQMSYFLAPLVTARDLVK